ncbi:RrF2 family transcriptional regulator [Planctomycetota bacterium]
MQVSQKSFYALRAIFELAKNKDQGPVKIADIAKAQAIPQRFLEVILSQLKQAGFVTSRRGNDGGYMMVREPAELTVGEVMDFIQGPIGLVPCMNDGSMAENCLLRENCVFRGMWEKLNAAISNVFNDVTFSDLVRQEKQQVHPCVASQ